MVMKKIKKYLKGNMQKIDGVYTGMIRQTTTTFTKDKLPVIKSDEYQFKCSIGDARLSYGEADISIGSEIGFDQNGSRVARKFNRVIVSPAETLFHYDQMAIINGSEQTGNGVIIVSQVDDETVNYRDMSFLACQQAGQVSTIEIEGDLRRSK